MIELLTKIDKAGIVVEVIDGELKLFASDASIENDLLFEIKTKKKELTDYLISKGNSKIKKLKEFRIPKAPESNSYPVSNAQLRLWAACQIPEQSVAYNIFNTLILDGSYDLAFFKKAVYSVIERHEILRTIFKANDEGEVRQYVLAPENFNFYITEEDCRNEVDPVAATEAYIQKDIQMVFDLEKGPLIRACLLQLDNEKFVFYYNMHHIVSDGWSMEILAKDVLAFYDALIKGSSPKLSELDIQYKDYSVWQLAQLESEEFQDHKEFWTGVFEDRPPVINLPSNLKRPAHKTYNGQRIAARISPELTTKLRRFTSERGGSLFMGLLAVLKVLIYRYTGEKDIAIGNPVSGRNNTSLENQIGFYINTLVLRNQLDPKSSFSEVFNKIKEHTLEAYKHQVYPFDRLLDGLKIQTEGGRSPLFDILVDYHGVSQTGIEFDSDEELKDMGRSRIKFDLELDPIEYKGGVNFSFGFNTDVYEQKMIEGFINNYKMLLEELIHNPEVSVNEVDILTKEEVNLQLIKFNESDFEPPLHNSVLDYLSEWVEKTPENTALVFEDEKLTYRELDHLSDKVAFQLLNLGVKKEDLVPVCLEKPMDMILAILGVMKSGAAYVPVEFDCPQQRLDFILGETNCKCICTTSDQEGRFEDAGKEIFLDILPDAAEDIKGKLVSSETDSNQLAYVIYTSGTTGKPKGVMIEHQSLMDYTHGLVKKLGIEPGRSFGLMSTLSADLGYTVLYGSLATGGALHTFSKKTLTNAYDLIAYFENNEIDIIKIVPSHWVSLCNGNDVVLPKSTIIFGGEILSSSAIQTIRERDPNLRIVNHYGPTETCVGKLLYEVKNEDTKGQFPIGKPFSDSKVYILSSEHNILPLGAVGELCIGGMGVARGYMNDPKLTDKKFVNHPFRKGEKLYKTGDLAHWSPEGDVMFLGRKDNQVKVNGYRIELEEIESALNELHNIERSAVLIQEDNKEMRHLVAYVVSKEFGGISSIKEGLIMVLEEKLPEYMIPKLYVKLDTFPLTSNGKIDKKALPLPEGLGKRREFVAPATELEHQLVQIWQDVMGIEDVGITDSFFDLGGSSLSAIKVNARMRKELNVKIEIKDLFDLKTIKELASHIDFSRKQEQIRKDNIMLTKIEL